MPDWSYRTVFRPLFFRLRPSRARDLCLGFMGGLARLPLGPAFIEFLGHMGPPERLRRRLLGLFFSSPVGLGPGIDENCIGLRALARFGVGLVTVGPVTVQPLAATQPIRLRAAEDSLWYPDPPANPGLATLAGRLAQLGSLGGPVLVLVGHTPGAPPDQTTAESCQVIERLAPHAALFALAADGAGERWEQHVGAALEAARKADRPLLVCLPPDCDPEHADAMLGPALSAGAAGVVVAGGVAAEGGRIIGPAARAPALRLVQHLRQRWGKDLPLLASGGVHAPRQALDLRDAGADLVLIDSGLIHAGPGLPKRINEAVLYRETENASPEEQAESASGAKPLQPPERSWFWAMLLGVSMFLGGLLALVIAATRVVLPYDEVFSGMTRDQLAHINDRLLAFMAHDRVSLAGSMISVGVLYLGLSQYGIRRGLHWAREAVLASAFAGFASFFLFLGFGYFDPFHAFVTAILFQFLLLALHSRPSPPARLTPPDLDEDRNWRLALWGQLLLIAHGAALIVAGVTISTVGITHVFVPEDLEFMNTTAEALRSANARLVPLVAHDRASFGGMLISCGLATLLPSLWGFRAGARWLWWTLLGAGFAGYAPAIAVHLVVGYDSLWHLAPAFAGAGVLLLGLLLARPFLCGR
jgi:dihydroorotate dehydrogenase